MWLAAGLARRCALYALWTYRQLAALAIRDRVMLLAVRIALFAVVGFALLRPMLLLKVAVPQQNFVGILLDDSRSMQIADQDGKPRSEFLDQPARPARRAAADRARQAVSGQGLPVLVVGRAAAVRGGPDVPGHGHAPRRGARPRAHELSGLPVAGLVLVTDGSDNAERTLDESIAGLKSQAMPVFAVGVGKDRLTRDVQVTRVETPRRSLKGASLVIDVVVTQTGYAGMKVPLFVEDDGRVVSSQDVDAARRRRVGDGEGAAQGVRDRARGCSSSGSRCRPTRKSRRTTSATSLIEVYNRREKILYLEGEPRPEPKFIRLATENDDNLQVVLLQRTAEATVTAPDKYLRLGVDGPEELQNGFPLTREELFAYRGIILGSVEASAFTADQLRMLEDFVDIRGGGLLALGGARSFSEGGWAGTPLADALPVVLDPQSRGPQYPPAELIVRPTRAGAAHPSTQIADTADDTAAKWRDLPPLTSLNPLVETKPGANVLLTGIDGRGREQVVLAYQRYGRGKTLVLPVQDTWLWRMHAKMDVKDMTHHTFWQRLVALAGRRRARSRHGQRRAGSRAEGRADDADRRSRRSRVQGDQRRADHGARDVAVGQGGRRADGLDGRARRRVPRALHAGRRRVVQDLGRRHDARRQGHRTRRRRRCAWRRATRSTSTPRCARRCCSASPRRPKAATMPPRMPRRSSTRSPTAARASPSSKNASCGTCRSC